MAIITKLAVLYGPANPTQSDWTKPEGDKVGPGQNRTRPELAQIGTGEDRARTEPDQEIFRNRTDRSIPSFPSGQ